MIRKLILALTMAAVMTFALAGTAFAGDENTVLQVNLANSDLNTVLQANIANQQAADQIPRINRIAADFAAIDTTNTAALTEYIVLL